MSSLAEEKLSVSERGAATRQLMSDLFGGLDFLSSTLIAQFTAERERWLRSAAFTRRDLVESVLSGASDGQVMSRRLGYDLSRHHLALLVWSDELTEYTARDLERAALRVLAGCTAQLLVVAGPTKLWAWGSRAGSGPRAEVPDDLDVHVAAGLPEAGTVGFRASHEQAVAVERLTRLAGRKPGLSTYEELGLVALAAENINTAKDFVRRELGPLSADDAASAELRLTLKAYLDHDKGVAAAAGELHVAKNTVPYRVRKAERLLDRSVRDDRLRLQVALHLADARNLSAGLRSASRRGVPPSAPAR
ncbi:helix-turn-helix domain-containing protein [Lentzea alba]|uniref:PucR family transcriptional regulator n=1 Tax=Lentzea alba TaxID=2714351 RepID=UPI0039BF392E